MEYLPQITDGQANASKATFPQTLMAAAHQQRQDNQQDMRQNKQSCFIRD
jgi:hypothetical protein